MFIVFEESVEIINFPFTVKLCPFKSIELSIFVKSKSESTTISFFRTKYLPAVFSVLKSLASFTIIFPLK